MPLAEIPRVLGDARKGVTQRGASADGVQPEGRPPRREHEQFDQGGAIRRPTCCS